MKHTTFDISFYCRESKTNRQGLAPIEMSIIINGERCIITLPRKEVPSEFKRACSSKRDNDIKQYLQAVRNKLGAIQTEMMEKDIPLTTSLLRDYFRTGGTTFSFISLQINGKTYIFVNANIRFIFENAK